MKNVLYMSLGVLIIMTASMQARSQGLLNVAFRPSHSIPLKDFGTTSLKKGGGFEVDFSYQFIDGFTVYGGWAGNIFVPEDDASFDRLKETGYRLGIQRIQPLSKSSKLNFLFSGGAVLNHIEIEDNDDIMDDTGHGVGWEAEVGLSIPLNENWQIVPGFRYHALSREMITDGVYVPVDLNYIAIGVAVAWTLVQD